MRFEFSEKQKDVIRFGREPGSLCLSEGPVRSGKSHASLAAFGLYILALEEPFEHLCLGKNVDSMESSVIRPLMNFAESLGVKTHLQIHKSRLQLGPQLVWIRGAENKYSAHQLQGLNCHSAIFDEVAIFDEAVFDMGLSRLSHKDSKCWMTANPEDPGNHIKEKIDKNFFDKHYEFEFSDNPFLTPEVVERLESSFHGVFYDRKILGRWQSASGLVFPDYKIVKHVPSPIKRSILGVDPGNGTQSAIVVLVEHENGKFTIYDEAIIRGKHTDDQIVEKVSEIAEKYDPEIVVVDSAASSTIQSLKELPNRKFQVKRAIKDINRGIRTLGTALKSERCRIHERCKVLLKELENYCWGTNEKPTKGDDHSIDCARYAGLQMFGRKPRYAPIPLPQGL